MKKYHLSLVLGSLVAISLMGCTVDKTPDVVTTPGDTTVIDKTSPSTPNVTVTTPPASHTETNTTTTVPPDGASSTTTKSTTTTG